MMTNQTMLVGRFWQHVFTMQDATAVLLKNPNPKTEFITSMVGPMGGGGVVVVKPRPYVDLPWKQVGEIVAEMIVTLQQAGVKRGDRVAILSWNCPEWVWTDLAIQTLGAVAVPIYPNSASEAVNYIVNDCGATLLIGDDGNQTNTDACLNTCKTAFCGDAVVQAGVDQCDDGNNVDNDGCTNTCHTPACGDSIVQTLDWMKPRCNANGEGSDRVSASG